MASKKSVEGRIVAYFRTAPLAEAMIVLGIVKETVRERIPERGATVKQVKKGAKKKVNSVAPAMLPGEQLQ